jgi:hypothetical protein
MVARIRRLRPFRPKRIAGLAARVDELERRLGHLELALEGLQDAVHRDSLRQNAETAELRRRTDPGEIARALSDDARKRGL